MYSKTSESPAVKPDGDSGGGEEHGLFIPAGTPGTEHLEPGDMLRVVGKDPDGAIEIEVASEPQEKKGMFDDYDESAVPNSGKPMEAEAGMGAPGE